MRLEGLDRILHESWRMAKPGRARIKFGAPLRLNGDNQGDDYASLARRIEAAVRDL